MSELALLARAFEAVPEPDDAMVAAARAALLERIGRRPAPRRLRLALVALALFLALAGIATATFVGVRVWVSSGPRGPQYAGGYRLATVFSPTGSGLWSDFALAPNGHDLYALRWRTRGATVPVLARIAGVDHGSRLRARRVFDLRQLTPGPPARVWPSPYVPYVYGVWVPEHNIVQRLSIAPNGDLFLAAGAKGIALFVLHPDGRRQEVSTGGELGLPGSLGAVSVGVVATARDRLWLDVDTFAHDYPFEKPFTARGHAHRLYEIVDPNADGDWSDRVVRRIGLPPRVGGFTSVQLVAEQGRARSVLLAAATQPPFWLGLPASYRVFRVSGRGPARLLLVRRALPARNLAVAPILAARTVGARSELVVAGLSRADRLSVFSNGREIHVGRSFPGFSALVAGPGGALYPVTRRGRVYRLTPGGSGSVAGQGPTSDVIPAPPASPPARDELPQILLTTYHGRLRVARADGSGISLAPGRRATCFSADRTLMAYRSDAQVPYEPFLYVANADGSKPREVSRTPGDPVCGFSTRWVLLSSGTTLVRHDLRTGAEADLRGVGPFFVLSPDGTKVAFADPHRGLMVLDVATNRRHLVAPRPGVFSLQWSPDGTRIAYVAGASRTNDVVWVRVAASGRVLFRRLIGLAPSLSWSPDGTRLAVCFKLRRGGAGSCGGATIRVGPYFDPPQRLLLVDVAAGSSEVVERGRLVYAAFRQSGELAYATWDALYLRAPDGSTRQLLAAPGGRWQAGSWLGWSPDGRFVGLGFWAGRLETLEVATGQLHVVYARRLISARWWQR